MVVMSNLTEALLDFKDRRGSNGISAIEVLNQIANPAYGPITTILNYSVVSDKMKFVEEGAEPFFKAIEKPFTKAEAYDNGGESLVFDCFNDYVLKVSPNQARYVHCDNENILKPVREDYSTQLKIGYGIFPKVEVARPTVLARMKLMGKMLCQGLMITDPSSSNFGYIQKPDKKDKSLVVIDSGAIEPVGLSSLYYAAKLMVKPLYQTVVPIEAQQTFRNLKRTVKHALHQS